MSRKTHSHKRTHPKRSLKRKPGCVDTRRYDWRTRILAGAIAATLLAGGTFAHWRAKSDEVLIAKNSSNPVKNLSTASARDLAGISPEALPPRPPTVAGYNARSGGLPPGALPPGVVLPGMPMMQGGRTTAQGYGMYDGIRQQFTGKERDTETGLDYFGARYYSPTQGRFTSVDPENAGADPEDPQSWNGYAYARNNPLKYQDPDGRKYVVCNAEGKDCVSYSDAEFYRIRRESQNAYGFTGSRDFYEGGAITQDGQTIATYRQTSIDNPVGEFIFETRRRTAPIPAAVGAFGVASVIGGVTFGAGAYYAPAVTAAIAERQIANRIASEVANATVNRRIYAQLEKQLAMDGAKSIYKALRSAEKALEEHVGKVDKLQFKSQVEGTIKNVANQIKTIQQFIKGKGL